MEFLGSAADRAHLSLCPKTGVGNLFLDLLLPCNGNDFYSLGHITTTYILSSTCISLKDAQPGTVRVKIAKNIFWNKNLWYIEAGQLVKIVSLMTRVAPPNVNEVVIGFGMR